MAACTGTQPRDAGTSGQEAITQMGPADVLRALSRYDWLGTLVLAVSMLPAVVPVGPTQISTTIQNFAISPNPITVAPGSTVTWTNLDGVTHVVTADDGSWGSGTLEEGNSYSHVFTSPGTHTYHCAIHPFMKGTVVVTP
jgi:plastocyanin